MSMTLAAAWVRRGVAAEFPQKYEVDEAELGRIEKLARLQLEDARDDLSAAQAPAENDDDEDESDDDDDGEDGDINTSKNGKNDAAEPTDPDDLGEYNLSDYDEEETTDTGEKFAMFGNVRSLAYHQAGEEDPYLVLPEGEADSEDEREELQILPTDNLILAAKVEDEVPHLEVFVYEDEDENIYVHHDIMLPAIPLCLEWLDFPVSKSQSPTNGAASANSTSSTKQGNLVAVGMMSPEIEIWDLDIVDSMYPTAILGQQPTEGPAQEEEQSKSKSKSKKSKKKKKPVPNATHHVEAVLALAINPHHRSLLASGSADHTLKLWDLNTLSCAQSYSMHAGKVCALDWHPTEPTILLSGSADDKAVFATDMRAPDATAPKWVLDAEIEKVRWDPHNPNLFYVTTESGTVCCFDARSPPISHNAPSKPVWTLQAHDSAVSAFDVSRHIPGFLVTGSDDKKVKLWNVMNGKPGMVVSRNLEVGRVFSATFAPDEEVAFRICVAGSRGEVQVWDSSTNPAIRAAFAGRQGMAKEGTKDRVIGAGRGGDDDDESDEDEGEGAEGWESMEED